jgi:hypothetical protein
LLDAWLQLDIRVREHNGGSPYLGRHLRGLVQEAGFVRSEVGVDVEVSATPDSVRAWAQTAIGAFRSPAFTDVVLGQGWTDPATLDATWADLSAWAERSDAFRAVMRCTAVAWKAG